MISKGQVFETKTSFSFKEQYSISRIELNGLMTIFHVKRTSSQDIQEWLDNFKGLKVFVTIVKFIVMMHVYILFV